MSGSCSDVLSGLLPAPQKSSTVSISPMFNLSEAALTENPVEKNKGHLNSVEHLRQLNVELSRSLHGSSQTEETKM